MTTVSENCFDCFFIFFIILLKVWSMWALGGGGYWWRLGLQWNSDRWALRWRQCIQYNFVSGIPDSKKTTGGCQRRTTDVATTGPPLVLQVFAIWVVRFLCRGQNARVVALQMRSLTRLNTFCVMQSIRTEHLSWWAHEELLYEMTDLVRREPCTWLSLEILVAVSCFEEPWSPELLWFYQSEERDAVLFDFALCGVED